LGQAIIDLSKLSLEKEKLLSQNSSIDLEETILYNNKKDYISAFKKGFNSVFDISYLKCFQSSEIEEILCGSVNETWDLDTLIENVVPNHGYDRNSAIYKYLISFMKELSATEKKKFLFFITGCPRLPLGGNIGI